MHTEYYEKYSPDLREGLRMGALDMDFSDVEREVDDRVLGDRAFKTADRIVQAAGLSEQEREDLHMVIMEILINAVKHGNRRDPQKRVMISYSVSAEKFTLSISDEGKGFDLEGVPDPLAGENKMRNSGRGMLLAEKYFDEVTVSRMQPTGCQVRLVKNREKDEHRPSTV